MSFNSLAFLAFAATTVIAFHAGQALWWRQLVLTVASAVFIASYAGSVLALLPLAVFLALGYAGLRLVRQHPGRAVLALCLGTVLIVYVVLKQFSFIQPVVSLPFSYLIVGLSYVLFRVLHLVIDARSGDVPQQITPLAYFRYTCNFLCFVSGPIQRYQDFAATDGLAATALDSERVYAAFARIVTGYVKFVVIGAAANYLFLNLSPQLLGGLPASPTALASSVKLSALFAACAATYTAYLYYNFSGYMDIVLGFGQLLGQELPENFNRPFASRSFLEFWQRWHMTLSSWFKLYLFNPLVMALMTVFPSPRLNGTLAVVAFFVTFGVMGLWHGTTPVFAVYGLLMGAGASINKLWQLFCTARLGKRRYRAMTAAGWYIAAARGLTVGYFAAALSCLWVPLWPQFASLVSQLGTAGIVGGIALLVVGFALSATLLDAVAGVWRGRIRLESGLLVRNVWLAGRILAAMAVSSLFTKAPEFVYRAF